MVMALVVKGTGNTSWLNSTTPPLAKYGVPTIPSSGDILSNVISTAAGSITGTIMGNADKVGKPLSAFENSNGFYEKAPNGSIETYVPKINKTIASAGDIASKGLLGLTLGVDLANTWTADSGNTNGQRLEKSGIQAAGAAASFGVGLVSAPIFAAGVASSEIGVGIPIMGLGLLIDAGGATAIDWLQKQAYKALKIK